MALYVLSLGGSLLSPDDLDHDFLKRFRRFINDQIKSGHRFIIVTGGGRICRKYIDALRVAGNPQGSDLDWMGIEVTRVNAKLVQLMFGKLANKQIVIDPNKKVAFREKILIAGGWKPGRSTDDDAVRLAKAYGAETIINLSNIDYAYDKDPRKFKNARKIEQTTWQDFRKLVGNKWLPGASAPFDPIASKFAQSNNLKVIITNGKDFGNLKSILVGKKAKGTVII